MSKCTLRGERGTAVTETLLLTWILILFVAAALQLFRVNQALYLSITSAHTQMFNGAWAANCFNKSSRCIYNSDGHAQVRWHPANMPEVLVPTVGMFRRQLSGQLRLAAWPGAATREATPSSAHAWARVRIIRSASAASGRGCMNSLHSVPGMRC